MISGGSWSRIEANGTPPSPRYGHSAIYSEQTHSIWIFGGYDNATGSCGDLHVFDLNTKTWQKIEQENKPPTRFCHCAFLVKEKESKKIKFEKILGIFCIGLKIN